MVVEQYKEHMDYIRFKAQTTPYLKYGRGNLLDFAALVEVVNGMNANAWIGFDDWDRVSLEVDPCVLIETTHLEKGQSLILIDYDHISYPVQPRHIYAVVALKDNKWGTNCWLERCI